jgi:hypothetical protein
MRRLPLALLLLALSAPAFAADDSSTVNRGIAAPNEEVHGRLIRRDLNFSLATPGSDWTWASQPGAVSGNTMLTVGGPKGQRFTVIASQPEYNRISTQWMVNFRQSLDHEALTKGFRVEDYQHSYRGSPVFPSFSFSYTRIDRKTGRRSYVDGYVAAGSRLYTLQYSSFDRAELQQFEEFVASFQLLDNVESQRAVGTPGQATQPGFIAPQQIIAPAPVGRPLAPNGVTPPPATTAGSH